MFTLEVVSEVESSRYIDILYIVVGRRHESVTPLSWWYDDGTQRVFVLYNVIRVRPLLDYLHNIFSVETLDTVLTNS